MADGRFTISIVPHAHPGVRKFQISARYISYGLIALAICSLIAIGTGFHYSSFTGIPEPCQLAKGKYRTEREP